MARAEVVSLVFLVVASITILGLSYYTGQSGARIGIMGLDYEGGKVAIAYYDLTQGDKIHYKWESDYLVRFVITDDAYAPEGTTFVNETGKEGAGSFIVPADARYYVQATFIEVPPGSVANVEYYLYTTTEFSESIIAWKPVVVASLTSALTVLLLWSWSRHRPKAVKESANPIRTFWQAFVSEYGNWIVIPICAAAVTVDTVYGSIEGDQLDQGIVLAWLGYLGSSGLILGLILGLLITRSRYMRSR